MQITQALPHRRRHPAITALRIGIVSLTLIIALLVTTLWTRPDLLRYYSSLFGDGGTSRQGDIAYGREPRQRLDIYRPDTAATEKSPIIVFVYGGSWSSGNKDIYRFAGQAFASRGFTTVIPDYRLYPDVQFPAFVNDIAAAYAWTWTHLVKACDVARPIILVGHSAGAHMAALLAVDPSRIEAIDASAPKPAALIGLAGPYTFQPTIWPSTKDAFASVKDTPDLARPVARITQIPPPALLIHGAADTLVELKNTREFAAALTSASGRVETEFYDNIGHMGLVLTLSRLFRWRAPTLDRIAAFAETAPGAANTTPACTP